MSRRFNSLFGFRSGYTIKFLVLSPLLSLSFCLFFSANLLALNPNTVEVSNNQIVAKTKQKPTCYMDTVRISDVQVWDDHCIYMLNNVGILDGGSLTIQPGVILKVRQYNVNQVGIEVSGGGKLIMNGAPTRHIYMAFGHNDSLGGSDPNGGNENEAVRVAIMSNGSLDMHYTDIRDFEESLHTRCSLVDSQVSISDNIFHGDIYANYCGESNLEFKRNRIIDHNAYLDNISDLSVFMLNGVDSNTFESLGTAKLKVSQSVLPADKSWFVNPASGVQVLEASLISIDGSLSIGQDMQVHMLSECRGSRALGVNSGGILSIQPGVVVSIGDTISNCVAPYGIDVSENGTVEMDGSPDKPIRFTKLSSRSSDYYRVAMSAHNARRLRISHTEFQYAQNDLIISGASQGTLSLSDNYFGGTVNIRDRSKTDTSIFRNTFAGVGHPVVSGVGNPSAYLENSDIAILSFDGVEANKIIKDNQNGLSVQFVNSYLSHDSSWTLRKEHNLPALVINNLTIRGQLTFNPGTSIKIADGASGITTSGAGEIRSNGTTTSPIVVTVLSDDSVGGDTLGDGVTDNTSTSYKAAFINNGGYIALYKTMILHANKAFVAIDGESIIENSELWLGHTGVVSEGGKTFIYESSIHNFSYGIASIGGQVSARGITLDAMTNKGVASCNWDRLLRSPNCLVDVSFAAWIGGVTPANDGICGAVVFSPWYDGDGTKYDTTTKPATSNNCDSAATEAGQLVTINKSFLDLFNKISIDCNDGLQDACAEANRRLACIDGTIDFADKYKFISFPSIEGFVKSTFLDDIFSQLKTNTDAIVYDGVSDDIVAVHDDAIVEAERMLKIADALQKSISLYNDLNYAYGTCSNIQ